MSIAKLMESQTKQSEQDLINLGELWVRIVGRENREDKG